MQGTLKTVLDPLENYMDHQWPYPERTTIRSGHDYINMSGGGHASGIFWLVYIIVVILTAGLALLAFPLILLYLSAQKKRVKVKAQETEDGVLVKVSGAQDWERAVVQFLGGNFEEVEKADECRKCGAALKASDAFCPSCGRKLDP